MSQSLRYETHHRVSNIPMTDTAQLGDRILAAQPGQHDPNLLLSRILLAGRTTDVAHMLFGRLSRTGFLSHLRSSFGGYDEPEILRYQITPLCLMNADGGQPTLRFVLSITTLCLPYFCRTEKT
jgi:hypothetical protein